MKSTIKDLDKKYQDNMSACQRMVEQQAAAKRDAERLNQEAEAAACSGNVAEYSTLKRQAREAEDLAYVLEKQIEKASAGELFTREEIDAAWQACADEHNKQMNEKRKKFAELKSDLLRQYAEMVSLQRETCAIRERLSGYIGLNKQPGAPDFGLNGRFPMDYIPCKGNMDAGAISIRGVNISDPDAVYYLSSFGKTPEALINDQAAHEIRKVVGFHQSK